MHTWCIVLRVDDMHSMGFCVGRGMERVIMVEGSGPCSVYKVALIPPRFIKCRKLVWYYGPDWSPSHMGLW